MSKRRITGMMTDRETGEQRAVTLEQDPIRGRRQDPSRGFVMIWTDEVMRLELPAKQLMTLTALTENCDDRGIAAFRLDELGERTNQATAAVWRTMESLYEVDAIRRIKRGWVQINPNIIWKGSISERSVAMVRWHNELDATPFRGGRKTA